MTLTARLSVSTMLALALGTLAACDAQQEEIGAAALAIGGACPIWECGGNSAEINDLPLGELHLIPGQNTGQSSQWNARIVDFKAPGTLTGYTLRVEQGRFVATKGTSTLTGSALLGSEIHIEDMNRGNLIRLHITHHDTIPSWTTPSFPIDRYVLSVHSAEQGKLVPVCREASETTDAAAWSVLVSGERYSWRTKSVIATGEEAQGWFNIACQGNSLYKMKLMGYDPQPTLANPHPQTTSARRQATLKMLTADYCGTGASFTEDGTSLHWFNQFGWADNGSPANSVFEAYWGHAGAVCLDAPRLGPEQIQSITVECASVGKTLPSCADFAGEYEWATETPL